jgi:hypothetical protein
MTLQKAIEILLIWQNLAPFSQAKTYEFGKVLRILYNYYTLQLIQMLGAILEVAHGQLTRTLMRNLLFYP